MQTSNRVNDEFRNALSRISTYAYFTGEGLSEPVVTSQMLSGMTENSLFDAFRFAYADGTYLTADGITTDVSDREYYINGMKGECGIFITQSSRITGEPSVSFYAPVYYRGEVIGVLIGMYSANEYLQHILSTVYFGEYADVYLCMQDGTVLANSQGEKYDGKMPDDFLEIGAFDEAMLAEAKDIFENGGNQTFICKDNGRTDNVCVIHNEESDFVLVQSFPRSITQNMIRNANRTDRRGRSLQRWGLRLPARRQNGLNSVKNILRRNPSRITREC